MAPRRYSKANTAMNSAIATTTGPAPVPAAPRTPVPDNLQDALYGQRPDKAKRAAKRHHRNRKNGGSKDSTTTTAAAPAPGEVKPQETAPVVDGAGAVSVENDVETGAGEGEELTTEVTAIDLEENVPDEEEEEHEAVKASPSFWNKAKAGVKSVWAAVAYGVNTMHASFLAVGKSFAAVFTFKSSAAAL